MRSLTPAILLLFAFVAVLFSIFGGDSRENLISLREGLINQRRQNIELRERVENLKRDAREIKSDDRVLEKTARNQLGLARPKDLIFVFSDKQSDVPKKDDQQK